MTTLRLHRTAPLGLAIILAIAGCSAPSNPEAPSTPAASTAPTSGSLDLSDVTIRFGQQGSETEAIWVASGVFDDTPYTVEYQTFNSPTNTLTALAHGDLDIANNLSTWTVTQSAAGSGETWDASTVPYQALLINNPTPYEEFSRFVVAASAKSGITSIDQLKGRKLGFLPGTSNHLIAAKVLQSQGLTFDDVEVVSLDTTTQVLAFETGEIDVFVTPIDNIKAALSSGATLLGRATEFGVNINTGYFVNAQSFADEKKRAALEDVVLRIIEAQNWSLLHPAEAQASIKIYRKFTDEQAAAAWEFQRYLPSAPTDELVASEQNLVDTAVDFGLIDRSVDVSVLYNAALTEQINAKLAEVDFQANFDATYQ